MKIIVKICRCIFIQGLFPLLILTQNSIADTDFKGIWQGYITATYEGVPLLNSGYTLNIKTQNDGRISGTAYIYRKDTFAFEGILDFIGTVDDSRMKVTELNILKEKLFDKNSPLCIKLMSLDWNRKDGRDFLSGKWDESVKNPVPNTFCPVGNVYLSRYDSTKPEGLEPIPAEVMQAIQADKSAKMNFLNTELADPIVINVSHPFLRMEISDYLKEDNDTISVYLNRRPMVEKLRIANKPFKLSFWLDRNSGLTEIILYAENLGSIPPNTSNLSIFDGEIEHRVIIRSTSEISAVLHLRYVAAARSD